MRPNLNFNPNSKVPTLTLLNIILILPLSAEQLFRLNTMHFGGSSEADLLRCSKAPGVPKLEFGFGPSLIL